GHPQAGQGDVAASGAGALADAAAAFEVAHASDAVDQRDAADAPQVVAAEDGSSEPATGGFSQASPAAAVSNVVELPRAEPPPAHPATTTFNPPTLAAPATPATFQRLMAAAAVPPGREPAAPADRVEMARVDAELLNQLLNQAGEVSIARSRVEQQMG